MLTRITLILLLVVASFNLSFCERQKRMMPLPNAAINLMAKANTGNISSIQERYGVNERVRDCADLYKLGFNKSGVYAVWPITRLFSMKRFDVYCDMTTDGGGWTVIQRRGNFKREDNFFDKNWQDYKTGFGNIKKDFWFGNDNIFVLTNQRLYSVRFDLVDKQQRKGYAEYDRFWIDDEPNKYELHISDYSGTVGNAMVYHDNMKFSTKDADNDLAAENCAVTYKGAWWFNNCYRANLNGLYHNQTASGIRWNTWENSGNLTHSEIKIRPIFY